MPYQRASGVASPAATSYKLLFNAPCMRQSGCRSLSLSADANVPVASLLLWQLHRGPQKHDCMIIAGGASRPLMDLRVSVTGGVHFDLVKRVLRDIKRSGQAPEEIIQQVCNDVPMLHLSCFSQRSAQVL